MVQTRSQAKTQANCPTVQNTKPVTQNAASKIARIPIKTGKEKDSKPLPSGVGQQLPKRLVMPLGTLIPPIGMQHKCQTTPKSPNVDNVTTSPNLGPEPNVDFEENSPDQEGIITETVCSPR